MALLTWLADTDRRFFPQSAPENHKSLSGHFALNERFSFQVLLRQDDAPRKFTLTADAPDGWNVRIRRIGYIPVRHANTPYMTNPEDADYGDGLPGFVPDPLFDETSILLPQHETHGFWFTVTPAAKAAPGIYAIKIRITDEQGKHTTLTYRPNLHDVRLQPRRDFSITHWFYSDSLVAQYKVKAFSDEFWPICEAYIRDFVAHGLNTLYVPAFTPPLDGVKLPTQLLRIKRRPDGGYDFDWTLVKHWLKLAQSCGIDHFEWTHPFTQWGVNYAIRIYEGTPEDENLLFPADTPATSDVYREFLTVYYGQLHDLLVAENLLDKSYFHVSDEPHGDEHKANYIKARTMLKEIAPWMKTMDALSDIAFGREKLTDFPAASIRTAVDFANENIECWCYYCCGPRGPYLNRLLDTPLSKIRMHGLLFYRWPFKGFLHWGFNYWFQSQTRNLIDIYAEQDGLAWPGWAYGDTCQVYPGKDGRPVDSIRWEVFGESLQDYQLLQTLGIARDDKRLAALKSFADFPKKSSWRLNLRRQLLG